MPLGSTHDRITLWTAPAIAGVAGWVSQDAGITLAVGSAYVFGGLMFSGDLDIRSRPYSRWLWLRWIWLPYRRLMSHRSFWSHGPIVGSTLRVAYLGGWILLGALLVAGLGAGIGWWQWQPQRWGIQLWQWSLVHQSVLVWIWLGLELGSISHSLSDSLVSRWKKWQRQRAKRIRS